MLVIEDNLGKKYDLVVAGTCTDSPFFATESVAMGSVMSSDSIQSFSEISASSKSFGSEFNPCSFRDVQEKNQEALASTDIEDLLFINNWLGNMLS